MAKKPKTYLSLPKTVKVGGKRMKIILHWGDLKEAGYFDDDQFEIHIDMLNENGKQVDDFYALHTYLHELIHAIDSVYCDSEIFVRKEGDEEFDHAMMNQFIHGLIQVLQDNNFLNRAKFWKPLKEKK